MYFFYGILLYGILFIFKVKTFLIEAFKVIRLRCYSDNSQTNKTVNCFVEFTCRNAEIYLL